MGRPSQANGPTLYQSGTAASLREKSYQKFVTLNLLINLFSRKPYEMQAAKQMFIKQ